MKKLISKIKSWFKKNPIELPPQFEILERCPIGKGATCVRRIKDGEIFRKEDESWDNRVIIGFADNLVNILVFTPTDIVNYTYFDTHKKEEINNFDKVRPNDKG